MNHVVVHEAHDIAGSYEAASLAFFLCKLYGLRKIQDDEVTIFMVIYSICIL
jgi:hypothetical protein